MSLQAPWTWRASLGLSYLMRIDCYLKQLPRQPGYSRMRYAVGEQRLVTRGLSRRGLSLLGARCRRLGRRRRGRRRLGRRKPEPWVKERQTRLHTVFKGVAAMADAAANKSPGGHAGCLGVRCCCRRLGSVNGVERTAGEDGEFIGILVRLEDVRGLLRGECRAAALEDGVDGVGFGSVER